MHWSSYRQDRLMIVGYKQVPIASIRNDRASWTTFTVPYGPRCVVHDFQIQFILSYLTLIPIQYYKLHHVSGSFTIGCLGASQFSSQKSIIEFSSQFKSSLGDPNFWIKTQVSAVSRSKILPNFSAQSTWERNLKKNHFIHYNLLKPFRSTNLNCVDVIFKAKCLKKHFLNMASAISQLWRGQYAEDRVLRSSGKVLHRWWYSNDYARFSLRSPHGLRQGLSDWMMWRFLLGVDNFSIRRTSHLLRQHFQRFLMDASHPTRLFRVVNAHVRVCAMSQFWVHLKVQLVGLKSLTVNLTPYTNHNTIVPCS